MALLIFQEMGWKPARPLDAYARPLTFIKHDEGEAMQRAGRALFARIENEPFLSVSVRMNLGLFYQLTEFVGEGAFIVGRPGAYEDARTNDFEANKMKQEPLRLDVNLKSGSLTADLLDCISAFSLFVDELRADGGTDKCTPDLIADLATLFGKADECHEDLSLLGAFLPDLLYTRVSELRMFDRWTRLYAEIVPHFLLDQLRVRGICSFYILDNSIREDRFDALVKIFSDAGYVVISPNLDTAGKAELLNRIQSAQGLRRHILYVERDASVDYLEAVRGLRKAPGYTVSFRNLAPAVGSMEILQLAATGRKS
jgi:hypothetical protein